MTDRDQSDPRRRRSPTGKHGVIGEAFPEAPGTTRPGDPPLEEPQGERSRHGGGGRGELDRPGER